MDRGIIKDWCIGLVLLKNKMIDQIDLKAATGNQTIEIVRHPSSKRSTCRGSMASNHRARIEITSYALAAEMNMALQYCRDGAAGADHTDIQIDFTDGTDRYLTIEYHDYQFRNGRLSTR